MRSPVRPFLRALGGLLLLAALTAPPARAAEIKIESPSFTFDSENHIYRYSEAKVTFGEISLEAAEVRVFADTSQVRANGLVRLRDRSLFISADRADFNAETGIGTIYNARLYDSQSGYYLVAETLKRQSKGEYVGEKCELTACPPFRTGWRIRAGEINYETNNFATGTNARLEAGDVPIFYFPILAWPTVDKRTSGFLQPSYSQWYSSLDRYYLGSRFTVPYFWAIGPDQDLTITPEYIERRGNALNLQYRYAFVPDQQGHLRLFGIHEQFARNPAEENNILGPGEAQQRDPFPSRYILDWAHNQPVFDSGRLVMSALSASDGQVLREYQNVQNYRPDLVYQASVTNQARWGDVGITAEHASEYRDESLYADRASFSDGDSRPALLPRVSYYGGGQPFGALPISLQLSSFTANFVTPSALSGQATVARPALVVPISFTPGLELRTTLQRSFVDYEGLYASKTSVAPPDPSQGYSQTEAQVELRADLARVYPPGEGGSRAIKHVISPRLIFDAVQDTPQPLADQIVRSSVSRQLVTLRLDNTWLGQSAYTPTKPSSRVLVPDVPSPGQEASGGQRVIGNPASALGSLNLIQRYNVLREDPDYASVGPAITTAQETDPGQPLLPLIVAGNLSLGTVTLGSELHYHYQLRRFNESSITLQGAVKSYSSLAISYTQNEFAYRTPEDLLHPEGTFFNFNGEVPVAERFSVGFQGTLNLRAEPAPLNRRLENGQMFLDFHPICYRLRFSYQESLQVTQQAGIDKYYVNRTIALTFDLGGLLQGTSQQVLSAGSGL